LAANPEDRELQRLVATSLVAADRCDEALTLARLAPSTAADPWPVLTAAQCLESEGAFSDAATLYEGYLGRHQEGRGVPAVRGRLLLARERSAIVEARAVVGGAVIPAAPSEDAVAVLPLSVAGDERYRPLGRGLAAQINSDLLTLGRFTMVERLNLQAILTELERADSPMMDSTTTPAFGRIVQAGTLVHGAAEIPGGAPVRLNADVVSSTGEIVSAGQQVGALEDLLRLEKELVFGISRQLGYEVSTAERTRILNNGTQNLMAFLAYSEGLELQRLGDFSGAAARFREAYRLDPDFEEARESLEASAGAEVTISFGPTEINRAVLGADALARAAVQADPPTGPDPFDLALVSGVSDVASTQAEQATRTVGGTTGGTFDAIQNLNSPATPPPVLIGLIRIVIIIPG
jgi:tetratricopeptide (TPR) repeat protein